MTNTTPHDDCDLPDRPQPYNVDAETVKHRAAGQWCRILQHVCGLTDEQLNPRKHQPCPQCGGTDRFRAFNDVDATGGLYCNVCHDKKNADGFASIMWLQNCTFPEALTKVVDALGLSAPGVDKTVRAKNKSDNGQTIHPTSERCWDAIAWGKWQNGQLPDKQKPDQTWMYHHADGSEVGAVARWNLADHRKTFGQIHRVETGWCSGAMPSPRPLYNLPAVMDADVVWICEGEKAADAISSLGLVATTPSQGSKSPKLTDWKPLDGKRVVILPDNDDAGDEFVWSLVLLLKDHASTATVEVKLLSDDWPEIPSKGDVVEWLLHNNTENNESLKNRLTALPDRVSQYEELNTGEFLCKHEANIPEIYLTLDEELVNNKVIQALAEGEDNLYQCNSQLVRLQRDEEGVLRILYLCPAVLRETISARVRFFTMKETKKEGPEKVDHRVPKWCVDEVHARGDWQGIRILKAVVTCPILRADGSVVSVAGYDAGSRVFLDLQEMFPSIPEHPAPDQVEEAKSTLLDVVTDFPFASEEHRATWVSAVLTPLARDSYTGSTGPLFMVDANVRGSGKSLLADLTAIIATGREAARLTNARDEDEARKRITALVRDRSQVILIDNIVGKFGNAALDAALTGVEWTDRILGRSETVTVPLRTTWMVTGNNIILAADTARRVAHIRLESPHENPEECDGFKFPDVRRYTRQHRPELIMAALTLLRGYFAAGCPDQKLKPWGSFEGWSDSVRSTVVWAGLPDPGETRTDLRKTSDSEAEALAALIRSLQQNDPHGHGLGTSDILKIARGQDQSRDRIDAAGLRDAVEMLVNCDIERVKPQSLGNKLSHFRRRVIGNKSLDFTKIKGVNQWLVVDAKVGPEVPGGPVSPDLTRGKKPDDQNT